MIRNYIKTAFRSLMKNKGFTLLNVLGLSVGLATCLLIVFYVVDEFSYDRYNVNAARIYRVTEEASLNGNHMVSASTEKLSRVVISLLIQSKSLYKAVLFFGLNLLIFNTTCDNILSIIIVIC